MKNYTIEVKECLEKPKKKEPSKPSSLSWVYVLLFAVVVAVVGSPDLIDLKTYIPPDHHENTNSF